MEEEKEEEACILENNSNIQQNQPVSQVDNNDNKNPVEYFTWVGFQLKGLDSVLFVVNKSNAESKVHQMLQTIKIPDNSNEKLAHAFINILILVGKIHHLISTHVNLSISRILKDAKIWPEEENKKRVETGKQIHGYLKLDAWKQIYGTVTKYLDRSLVGSIYGFASNMFQLLVQTPNLPQFEKYLSIVDFASNVDDNGYVHASLLESVCYNSSLVFQMGLLSIQNTESFTYLHKKAIRLFKEKNIDTHQILAELAVNVHKVSDKYPDYVIKQIVKKSLPMLDYAAYQLEGTNGGGSSSSSGSGSASAAIDYEAKKINMNLKDLNSQPPKSWMRKKMMDMNRNRKERNARKSARDSSSK